MLVLTAYEPRKDDALLVLAYDHHKGDEVGRYFDEVVARIKAKEFTARHVT